MKIGIDIQDVEKVKTLSVGTLARIFTSRELKYIESKNDSPQTVAGIWAAKEAYFKALGTGIQLSKLGEVEVNHDEYGAPFLVGMPNTSISISHSGSVSVAVCVIF